MKMRRIQITLISCVLSLTMVSGVVAKDFSEGGGVISHMDHNELIKDKSYKMAYDGYIFSLNEALTKLDKEFVQNLKNSTNDYILETMEAYKSAGYTEAEAWKEAYIATRDEVDNQVKNEWLRRNPKGVQGYYEMANSEFLQGFMRVTGMGEPDLYFVELSAWMVNPPNNQGEYYARAVLEGNVLSIQDAEGFSLDVPITILFDGDKATVVEMSVFKESGLLGRNVTFDGAWMRQTK